MTSATTTPPKRLAAVIFDRGDDVDATLRAFVAHARRDGARVAGFLQERIDGAAEDDPEDVQLRDLETGATLAIMQDLGPGASGCRLDPAALAVAAARLGRALDAAPDLLVVNRFGKFESEGGGVLAELGEAVARGVPVVVCVPARFLDAWNSFADGLDDQLPSRLAAIEAWWMQVSKVYEELL